MHVAANILAVGALVFIAHALTALFSRARVPDVLLLTVIGILLGPVLHLVKPSNFGSVGPVFAAVTLVILLFEAGLSLDLDVIRGAIRPTLLLTITNFLLTIGAVSIAAHFLTGMSTHLVLMLGAIIGSTSPAVIVPLTKKLNMAQSSKTTLCVEYCGDDWAFKQLSPEAGSDWLYGGADCGECDDCGAGRSGERLDLVGAVAPGSPPGELDLHDARLCVCALWSGGAVGVQRLYRECHVWRCLRQHRDVPSGLLDERLFAERGDHAE